MSGLKTSTLGSMNSLNENPSHKIALALSGGGPLGAIYEVGAMCALEDCLDGLDFTRLNHYVGVSAGSFLAALLANGVSPRAMCASFIENDREASIQFDPTWLMQPAYSEYARRMIMLPELVITFLWQLTVGRKSLFRALERLSPAIPTGIFANQQLDMQLARLFNREGRTNDFRKLKNKLTLVATNLDSAEAAPFGRPGWDHIPISQAVQASSALPGLFPPVEINDQYYVDGALKKTMHASVALDEGVDLLICLNPLVPFDATAPQMSRSMMRGVPPERRKIPRIVDGGLPAVLSQTFRSMIHSRMELGMKHYERAYPKTSIVLFEPDHRDPELYMTNLFSYAQRRKLAEHAYQQTRQMVRARKAELSDKLGRFGITINEYVLEDPKRCLSNAPIASTKLGRAIATLQELIDDLEDSASTALRKSVQ
jgi:NTE family protein